MTLTKRIVLIIQFISIWIFSFVYYVGWQPPVSVAILFIFTLLIPWGGSIVDVVKSFRLKLVINKKINDKEEKWLSKVEYENNIELYSKENKTLIEDIINGDLIKFKNSLKNNIIESDIDKYLKENVTDDNSKKIIFYFIIKLNVDTKDKFLEFKNILKKSEDLNNYKELFYILIPYKN